MAQISDLKPIYSGGASNTSGDASLGGQISTATGKEILSQNATGFSQVTGVTLVDAMSNSEGNGTLSWTQSTTSLGWQAPGSGTTYYTAVSGNGVYTVGSPNGYLVLTVVSASLPVSNKTDTIAITTQANKLFDNISAAESLAGDVEYRCFYIKNTHASDTMNDVRVWIRSQPTGEDELDICKDPAGKGNGSTTGVAEGPINTEQDLDNDLSGFSFTRPSSQATGLQCGNLAAGECHAIWVRRTIGADTTEQTLNDLSEIGFSALV